jgi:hypothetical protein
VRVVLLNAMTILATNPSLLITRPTQTTLRLEACPSPKILFACLAAAAGKNRGRERQVKTDERDADGRGYDISGSRYQDKVDEVRRCENLGVVVRAISSIPKLQL